MAGKGELVKSHRETAKNKKQREELKREIGRLLDTATTTVTVITLVGQPGPGGEYKGRAKTQRKKA